MEGYIKAAEIDILINKFAEEEPVTADTARDWLTFTRTVESTCRLLELRAVAFLLEEQPSDAQGLDNVPGYEAPNSKGLNKKERAYLKEELTTKLIDLASNTMDSARIEEAEVETIIEKLED